MLQQQQRMQPMLQPQGMMMYPGGMIPMAPAPMMMMPGHPATMPILPSQKSSSMQRMQKKVVTEEVVQKSEYTATVW